MKADTHAKGNKDNERVRKFMRMRKILACLACFVPILIFLIPTRRMTGVVFLDVGQGLAVLLEESGRYALYDTGLTG